MRFLLDQSTDARLLGYLRGQGHDALRVGTDVPAGLPDTEVMARAAAADRILITDDRDFGELVVRRRQPHAGVIYLRVGSGRRPAGQDGAARVHAGALRRPAGPVPGGDPARRAVCAPVR